MEKMWFGWANQTLCLYQGDNNSFNVVNSALNDNNNVKRKKIKLNTFLIIKHIIYTLLNFN